MRSILLLALVRSRSRFDRCEERSEDVVRVWLEGEDPRMEEMLEWAQRACFRIAEVTVMHSVTTSDTGSMATGMDAIPGPRGGECGCGCSYTAMDISAQADGVEMAGEGK